MKASDNRETLLNERMFCDNPDYLVSFLKNCVCKSKHRLTLPKKFSWIHKIVVLLKGSVMVKRKVYKGKKIIKKD